MQCGSHTKVMKSTEFMFTSFNDKSNDILNSLFSAQFGVCNSGFRFFFYCAHRYHATTHIESICRQSNHRYCWLRILPSRITCDCCETVQFLFKCKSTGHVCLVGNLHAMAIDGLFGDELSAFGFYFLLLSIESILGSR